MALCFSFSLCVFSIAHCLACSRALRRAWLSASAVGCVTRALWCGGGGACWLPAGACGLAFSWRGYWRVVGEGMSPLFLLPLGAPLGCGEAKGGGVWRVFSFFFCVKGVVFGGCEVACE